MGAGDEGVVGCLIRGAFFGLALVLAGAGGDGAVDVPASVGSALSAAAAGSTSSVSIFFLERVEADVVACGARGLVTRGFFCCAADFRAAFLLVGTAGDSISISGDGSTAAGAAVTGLWTILCPDCRAVSADTGEVSGDGASNSSKSGSGDESFLVCDGGRDVSGGGVDGAGVDAAEDTPRGTFVISVGTGEGADSSGVGSTSIGVETFGTGAMNDFMGASVD